MLVPVVFEENESEKLVLGVDLFQIFAGIRGNPYCFHDRERSSDKPDTHSGKETMYFRSFGRRCINYSQLIVCLFKKNTVENAFFS